MPGSGHNSPPAEVAQHPGAVPPTANIAVDAATLQQALQAITLSMQGQQNQGQQRQPAWKAAKNIKIDPFQRERHSPFTWITLFAAACRAQNIPDEDIWVVFTQNVKDLEVLSWAAGLEEATKQTLVEVEKAFLAEFGRSERRSEKALMELMSVRQGPNEDPKDFCRRVTQEFRRLHQLGPGAPLDATQKRYLIAALRQGFHPAVADMVWTANATTLEAIMDVAGKAADRADLVPHMADTINTIRSVMKEEIKPLLANAHADMVGQVGSTPAPRGASGWADVPQGETQPADKGNYASNQNSQIRGSGGRGGKAGGNGRNTGTFRGQCWICGVTGHRAATCAKRIQPPRQQNCQICGEQGHKYFTCPQNPNSVSGGQVGHVGSQTPQVMCQLCTQEGHSAAFCPLFKR